MRPILTSSRALFTAFVLCSACGPRSNSQSDGGTSCGTVNTADTLNTTFDPCFTRTSPNKPGTVQVTVSGEVLGENGLPFQPASSGDPVFVDGWNLSFDKFLVVVGRLRLSPNATQSALQNQLSTSVATRAGPYVIDIHKLKNSGANGFTGSDGEEPASALFKWDAQDDGASFDTSVRYAFSYDVQPATRPATQVNLSADEFALYDQMVQHGWSKYIEGTATYVGTGTYPEAGAQAKFSALPTTVHFTFGWNDATSYLNCVNADLGDGEALENRGLQANTNGATTAQLTLHVDHLFWDKLLIEGTPLRFDPIAAWATPGTTLSINALATKPLATTFNDGTPLPDRAPYQHVAGGYTSDQTNPAQVTLDVGGVPAANIAGLGEFMAFSAQSQMHLNADGLCYVVGQHASDPWFDPSVQ
jgi:hypothetical protein